MMNAPHCKEDTRLHFGHFLKTVWLCVLAVGVCGCALFGESEMKKLKTSGAEATTVGRRSLLRPIQPSPNTLELEIVFIDRLADDPLLGERLWQDVDQVAALSAESRARLKAAGFRVGQVGTTFPPALEVLLNMEPDTETDEGSFSNGPATGVNKNQTGFVVRRVAILSGSDTEIETSPLAPVRKINMPTDHGSVVREFHNARCVVRVRVFSAGKGWAKVEFTPEVHHGPMLPRATPQASGWLIRTRQEIEPLYGLHFSINLNLNESVLMTCWTDDPQAPGFQFFRGPNASAHMQRLVLVRLARVPETEPVYAE